MCRSHRRYRRTPARHRLAFSPSSRRWYCKTPPRLRQSSLGFPDNRSCRGPCGEASIQFLCERRGRRGYLRLEILLAIHPDQLEEIAERERADEQAEQPEVAHATDGPDQRNQRVNGGESAINERPDEVVHAADDNRTRVRLSSAAWTTS